MNCGLFPTGFDFVLLARREIVGSGYHEVEASLLKLLKRLKFDGDVPCKIVLILLIRFYQQVISPLKTNLPVLSYVFSLCGAGSGKYGAWKGFWLAVKGF